MRVLLFIALDFREWLGGEEKINEQCHKLALEGGKRLAEILGTSLLDESETGEETLNMVRPCVLAPVLRIAPLY